MMTVFHKLKMTCKTNPDLNSKFNKDDVEQEMLELDYVPVSDDDWIEYVMNHYELPDGIFAAICCNDIYKISFKLDKHVVDIVKS